MEELMEEARKAGADNENGGCHPGEAGRVDKDEVPVRLSPVREVPLLPALHTGAFSNE